MKLLLVNISSDLGKKLKTFLKSIAKGWHLYHETTYPPDLIPDAVLINCRDNEENALKKIKEYSGPGAIFILVPAGHREAIKEALELGVKDFITSADPEEIVTRIDCALGCNRENAVSRKIETEISAGPNCSRQSRFFAALFENSPDAIVLLDHQNRVLDLNNRFTQLFGYSLAEAKDCDLDKLITKEEFYHAANQLTKNLLQGQHVIIEATRYSKEGKPVDVSIKGIPVVIDGITVGGFCIYTDIGERKQAENALQKSEERYKQILSSIIEGYYETDLNGNITFFNDALCQLTGYSPEELKNLSYKKIYPNAEKVYQIFNQVYRTGKPFQGFTLEVWNKNGSLSYAEISVSLLEDENGNIIGFRGLARDVTERKNFEERLKYLSLHDQLTGLHNRAYFQEELERLEGSRNYPITIIFADLDGLKLVNDTRGHQQGDEMLLICADAIKKCLRQEDLLARVGGDEFCAILPKTDENTGKEIVERIQSYLEHLNKDQPDYPLSISIGVSTVNNAEIPLQEAYIKADNLMNLEKLSRSTRLKNQTIRNLLTDIPEMSNLGREHISRLIPLCRLLGEGMGLAPLQLEQLLLLVQMHDVGQSSIPAEILKKRGPLTAKEWNQIREHPEKGYRIARSSTELMPAADLILHHHEWWDGSGYPLGLKGEEIPIHCRILAVVDAFDVMTHQQYYRQAATVKEASDQLKLYSGKQFDPQVVEKFLSLPEIVKRLSR